MLDRFGVECVCVGKALKLVIVGHKTQLKTSAAFSLAYHGVGYRPLDMIAQWFSCNESLSLCTCT